MGRASASAPGFIAPLCLLAAGTAAICLGGCSMGRIYPFASHDSGLTNDADAGSSPDVSEPDVNIGPCPTTLLGYATVDGGVTGGGDAAATTVTTLQQLKDLANASSAAVIRIGGTIVATDSPDAAVSPVEIASDKTIETVTPGDGLFGTGFIIKEAHNVIVRNVTITKAFYPSDAITIQKSDHVWVDHCDLSTTVMTSPAKTYDDLVDVTHASDAVTISWTRFHDHLSNSASLVGHSADNGAEDTGHLTVTYHHNLFLNIATGSPRTRFGHIHVFNNYYLDSPTDNPPVANVYAIASASAATVLAEANYFALPAGAPIVTHWEDTANPDGTVWDLANLYDPTDRQSFNVITTAPNNWRPPYAYHADSATSVPALITACAGPGKVP